MALISSYQGELTAKRDTFQSLGRKEGGKNRPPSDAIDLDGHEADLLGEANKHITNENFLFEQALVEAGRAATDSRAKLVAMHNKAEQLLADDSLEGKITSQLSAARGGLERVTEKRLRVEAEYKWFREHHGIMEDAVYPDSLYHHFGWVAIFFLFEAVANAFFYRNQGGLLGGLMVAMIISGLNLAMAVLLGWAFRYRNLSGWQNAVRGYGSFAVFIILTVFFAALFATFRSEYQLLTDPGDPQQLISAFGKAWPLALGIFTFHFHFMDIFSFLLFWVSLLLSCLAFWKGYTMDDKHPGYSEKDRALKRVVGDQVTAEAEVRASITRQLEQVQREVEATIQEPRNLLDSLTGKDAHLQQMRNEQTLRVNKVAADFKMVLQGYRQANVAVRAVSPPTYFQHIPELAPATLVESYDSVRGQLSEVSDQVRATQQQFKEPLAAKKREAQSLSARMLSETLPHFLVEVRQEAEAAIARTNPTIQRRAAGNT